MTPPCAGAPPFELWHVAPTEFAASPETLALLSPDEHEARARLRCTIKQHEYLTTRVLARIALATRLDCAPAALTFWRTPFGQPYLVEPQPVAFSLANTAEQVVCFIGANLEVGVDVEPLARGASILGLAPMVFSLAEQADLAALEPDAQARRAVELWTLKEAYLKARGLGMHLPLEAFAFRLGAAPRLELAPSLGDDAPTWSFHTLMLGACVVSLVVRGQFAAPLPFRLHPYPTV